MYAVFMSEPNDADRATIKKSARGGPALNEAMALSGENVTDAYNRSMILYALMLRETQEREKGARPGEVIFYLTDPKDPAKTDKFVFA